MQEGSGENGGDGGRAGGGWKMTWKAVEEGKGGGRDGWICVNRRWNSGKG